jgi:hypothetical protein
MSPTITPAYLVLALILAFLAEGLTEYFAGPIFKWLARLVQFPELADLRYVAALVGIGLAFAYRLDLLLAAGFHPTDPIIGLILTGLVIGRGSNYLHQFVAQFFPGRGTSREQRGQAPDPPAATRG